MKIGQDKILCPTSGYFTETLNKSIMDQILSCIHIALLGGQETVKD